MPAARRGRSAAPGWSRGNGSGCRPGPAGRPVFATSSTTASRPPLSSISPRRADHLARDHRVRAPRTARPARRGRGRRRAPRHRAGARGQRLPRRGTKPSKGEPPRIGRRGRGLAVDARRRGRRDRRRPGAGGAAQRHGDAALSTTAPRATTAVASTAATSAPKPSLPMQRPAGSRRRVAVRRQGGERASVIARLARARSGRRCRPAMSRRRPRALRAVEPERRVGLVEMVVASRPGSDGRRCWRRSASVAAWR